MSTTTLEKPQAQADVAAAVKIEDLLSGANSKVLRGALTQSAVYLDNNTDEMASKRYGKEMSLRPLVHNAIAAERTCEELGIPVQEGHTAQDVIATAGRRLGLTPEATAEVVAGMDISKSELPAPDVVSKAMKQEAAMTAFLCNVKAAAPELFAEKVPEPLQHAVDVQLATLAEDRDQKGRAQYRTPDEKAAQSVRVAIDVDVIQDWKAAAQTLAAAQPDKDFGRVMKELDNLEQSFRTSYATRLPKLNVEGEKTGVVLTGKGCAEKIVEVVKAAQAIGQQLKALGIEVKAPEAEVKAPEAEVKAPEAEVKAPEAQAEAPEAQAEAPEAEVKAPEAEVKAPEIEDIAPTAPAAPEAEAPAKAVEAPKAKAAEAKAAKPRPSRAKAKDKDVELG